MSEGMMWALIWGFAWPAFWALRSDWWRRQRVADRMARAAGDAPAMLRNAAQEQELKALRERVKVLERIATDGRHSTALADEIEALRDK